LNPFNKLSQLDDFLIDKLAQPIVDKMSKRFGTHFTVIGSACFGVSYALEFYSYFMGGDLDIWPFSFRVGIMIMYFCTLMLALHQVRKQSEMTINLNRYNLFVWRIGQLVISLFLLVTTSIALKSFILTIGLYILSCNQGPPKEKRVPASKVAMESA
jgi:hypothetical protein